jgi:hypothetical protein
MSTLQIHEISVISDDGKFQLGAKVKAKSRVEAAAKLRKAMEAEYQNGLVGEGPLSPDITEFTVSVDPIAVTANSVIRLHDIPEDGSAMAPCVETHDPDRAAPTVIVIGCPPRKAEWLMQHTDNEADWIFLSSAGDPPDSLPPNDFVVEIHYHTETAEEIQDFYTECGRPSDRNIIVWSRKISVSLARKISARITHHHREHDRS